MSLKIRLGLLLYQHKDKLIPLLIGLLVFIIMLPAIILTALNPFKDSNSDPYVEAYNEIVSQYKIDDLTIVPQQLKTADLVIYEDITKRTKSEVKSDLIKYYIYESTIIKQECEDDIETKCKDVEIKYYRFYDYTIILNKLKEVHKLNNQKITDIEGLISLQGEAGTMSTNGVYGSNQIPIASGEFVLPTAHGQITCSVGCYGGHIGTDIGAEIGIDIYSITDAVVIDSNYSCDNNGYLGNPCGNYITTLSNINGVNTVIMYYHISPNKIVKNGDSVAKGTKIGVTGNSGNSSGPHTHIEVIPNATYVEAKEIRMTKFVNLERLIKFPKKW